MNADKASGRVLKLVLRKITPQDKEIKKAQKVVDDAIKLCKKAAKDSAVVVCGSFAKDTYLAGLRDIDVFFILNPNKSVETDGMADVQAAAAALGGQYEKKFSSHPYLSATYKGFVFDLVPAYDASSGEQVRSAVDRTPLHTEYINNHLGDKNQARLIKAFCRGIGVYGADSKNLGFSGYLCELLAVKYGTFVALLQQAAGFKHPFEFTDPVDETRNVASAVSAESLATFKDAAASFLKRPSEAFFFPRKLPKGAPKIDVRKDAAVVYTEELMPADSLHSRARSSLAKLAESMESVDFKVAGRVFALDEASRKVLLLLRFERKELSKMKTVDGPPLNVRLEYLDAFVQKHGKKETFQKDGRLFATQERRLPLARSALQSLGRAFLSAFTVIDEQHAFQQAYASLPEEGRRKIFLFLTGKRPWQV